MWVHARASTFPVDDDNIVLPQLTRAGYLWPPSGAQKVNPNVGRLDILMWRGDSNYDALQLQLNGRASHGMQFQASYTWAKSTDTGSATIAGDQFATPFPVCPG